MLLVPDARASPDLLSGSDPNEFILHECHADKHAEDSHKNSEHYLKIVVEGIIPHLEILEVTVVTKIL